MKNIIAFTLSTIIILSLLLTSCGRAQQTHEHKDATEVSTVIYACPMHPEITGKEGDKCSKCGMMLTKSSADSNKEGESEHEEQINKSDTIAFSCPMHKDVIGKQGEKCSKCNMNLTAFEKESSMKSCKNKSGKACDMKCCSKTKSVMTCSHEEGKSCPHCKKA